MIFLFWGGELLIEIFDFVDFDVLQLKWIVGYLDISMLLFVIILKIGIVIVYGINFIDLRGNYLDKMIVMWKSVLEIGKGELILQCFFEKY